MTEYGLDAKETSPMDSASYQTPWVSKIISQRHPLEPIDTDVAHKLSLLEQVRCVVFDVYGTLLVSGSGDVGSADTTGHVDHIADAFADCGLQLAADSIPTLGALRELIESTNRASQSPDCPKPEVDIVAIWRQLLTDHGLNLIADDTSIVVQIATAFEARSNPTWPMPGAADLIAKLKSSGVKMGIVSNAQIFTPALVENLCGASSLEQAGFDLDLSIFSNRFRQSKPGPRLFDVLLRALTSKRILPQQVVYVGNDMLNDIYAASRAGLRTAWFAGDKRSCRRRSDDLRCSGVNPDIVLGSILDLQKCLHLH